MAQSFTKLQSDARGLCLPVGGRFAWGSGFFHPTQPAGPKKCRSI
jgi:hypothetical protein